MAECASGPPAVAGAPEPVAHRPHPIDRVPAPVLVLSAIASVQVGSAVAHDLFSELGTSGVLFLRLSISAVVLLAVVRPRVRSWSRSTLAAVLVMGVVVAALNQTFYLAIAHLPLGIVVTIEFLGPLLLSVAQTRRPVDLLWALLALAGVGLLGLGAASGAAALSAVGIMLALLSGLLWAMYILASARVGAALPGMDGLAVAITVAAILILPIGGRDALVVLHRPSLLLPAALVALLSSLICYSFDGGAAPAAHPGLRHPHEHRAGRCRGRRPGDPGPGPHALAAGRAGAGHPGQRWGDPDRAQPAAGPAGLSRSPGRRLTGPCSPR